jgi:NAD(P)-dependent dehydrogenase (short-subunit alcohol dehydrogenase family)
MCYSVAFITGAGSGIGLAVAQRLVADGIKKIVLVDLTEARLSQAFSSLSALDSSAQILKIGADCSQVEKVDSAVEEAVKKFGRLDVCFNGAGIAGEPGSIVDQSTENLDNVLGLNLKGVWYSERAQIRQMLKQELRNVS